LNPAVACHSSTLSLLNELPDVKDAPHLEDAVRCFHIAQANELQDEMIAFLNDISFITSNSPFSESDWNRLLASELIEFIATELRKPECSSDMWKPYLFCFKSILRYPPPKHLLQIDRIVSEDIYIQTILGYRSWIPPELLCTYVHIVCVSVAIYCPDIGAVFDRLTAVYKRVLDDDASICQIQELANALCPVLENHGPHPGLWMAVESCLRGFAELVVTASFEALSDKAIIAVLEGMEHIAVLFPSFCSQFYGLDFCLIDCRLRDRGALYPGLRSCLLESIRELAEYRPLLLPWTGECMRHFCGNEETDLGVPGLGITALLFARGCRPFPDISDFDLCVWFLDELSSSPVGRMPQLLRSFAIFLTHAQPNINYIELFPCLAPILDDCMDADAVSEIVLLSLHILEWLVVQAVANREILSQMSSLARIREELDDLPETARCMLASWIEGTLQTIEVYLDPGEAGEPVVRPPMRFSDDDFTLYSTDDPLPEMNDEQESFPPTAMAARIEELANSFGIRFDFDFTQ
jgi:hypothetical protein